MLCCAIVWEARNAFHSAAPAKAFFHFFAVQLQRTMPSVVTLLVLGLVLFISVSMATTPEGLKYLEAKALEKGVTKLPSGLLYKVLKEGSPGGKSPEVNSPCDCHYQGTLMDGTVFDSSYKRGQPTTFAPNQVSGQGSCKGPSRSHCCF